MRTQFPVSISCEVRGVSASGYFVWQRSPERRPSWGAVHRRHDRVVVARKRHPLGRASSLAELVDSEWMLTGLREREAQEHEELFGTYGLPAPKAWIRLESTLGLLSILGATDALVLLPRQWDPGGSACGHVAW